MMCAIFAFENLHFRPVHTKTISRRFQQSLVWEPFSKTGVFDPRKRRSLVDGRLKRVKTTSFFKNNRTGVDGAWNMLKVSDWKLFVEILRIRRK